MRWPRLLPAGEDGGALAVHGGRAQEGAVEHGPLEVDLDLALPGEADPAVGLDRVQIDGKWSYSPFVPTTHLPGASTSPPLFRNGDVQRTSRGIGEHVARTYFY